MISLMNSIALATVMEVACTTLIHLCEFVHYYEDVCESTFGFLEWTYQIQSHVEKGQVIGMV
jgi:hypothetical protein